MATRCGRPDCSTRPIARTATPWRSPDSSRARYGVARSLAATSHLEEALDMALAASAGRAARRRDPLAGRRHLRAPASLRAGGQCLSQLHQPAAQQGSQREGRVGARAGRVPRCRSAMPARGHRRAGPEHAPHDPLHAEKEKIVVKAKVNGGKPQDFVLDTGSEETVMSRETASRERVRPITYTLSAGVGEVGIARPAAGATRSRSNWARCRSVTCRC